MMKAWFKSLNINGPKGLVLGGYANRSFKSQGILSDVEINIGLFNHHDTNLIWLSLDACAISDDIYQKIYHKLKAELDYEFNLIISASHTHSGYAVFYDNHLPYKKELIQDLKLSDLDLNYLNDILNLIVIEIKKASLQEVLVSFDTFETECFASNRHNKNKDYHNEVHLSKFGDNDGKVYGSIINLANHPTVLGSDNILSSSDYVGELRKQIQNKYPDCVILFTQADAACISTRFTRKESTLIEASRLVEPINIKIKELLSLDGVHEVSRFSIHPFSIELKTKSFKFIEIDSDDPNDILGQEIKQKMSKLDIPDDIQIDVHFILINEIVYLILPFELDDEIGRALRKQINNLVIVGYSNDYLGYLVNADETIYESLISLFDLDAVTSLTNQILSMWYTILSEEML